MGWCQTLHISLQVGNEADGAQKQGTGKVGGYIDKKNQSMKALAAELTQMVYFPRYLQERAVLQRNNGFVNRRYVTPPRRV